MRGTAGVLLTTVLIHAILPYRELRSYLAEMSAAFDGFLVPLANLEFSSLIDGLPSGANIG